MLLKKTRGRRQADLWAHADVACVASSAQEVRNWNILDTVNLVLCIYDLWLTKLFALFGTWACFGDWGLVDRVASSKTASLLRDVAFSLSLDFSVLS